MTYAMLTMLELSIHPYDVLECEPELVSGYYVDLGGVCFMVVYLAEGMLAHRSTHAHLVVSTQHHVLLCLPTPYRTPCRPCWHSCVIAEHVVLLLARCTVTLHRVLHADAHHAIQRIPCIHA